MKLKNDKGYYVKPPTPEVHEAIQKFMFALGIGWIGTDQKIERYGSRPISVGSNSLRMFLLDSNGKDNTIGREELKIDEVFNTANWLITETPKEKGEKMKGKKLKLKGGKRIFIPIPTDAVLGAVIGYLKEIGVKSYNGQVDASLEGFFTGISIYPAGSGLEMCRGGEDYKHITLDDLFKPETWLEEVDEGPTLDEQIEATRDSLHYWMQHIYDDLVWGHSPSPTGPKHCALCKLSGFDGTPGSIDCEACPMGSTIRQCDPQSNYGKYNDDKTAANALLVICDLQKTLDTLLARKESK
jgi:hypothetical protein